MMIPSKIKYGISWPLLTILSTVIAVIVIVTTVNN